MSGNLLLISNAREQSNRCINKMTRTFGNTTLFDIHMSIMEEVQKKNNDIFDDIIVGVSDFDEKLWKMSQNYDVKIQNRNKNSVTGGNGLSETLEYLKYYDQKYVMWVNASSPFISPDSILFFGDFFNKNDMESLHAVRRRVTWFWVDDKPINIAKKTNTQTQESQPVYESLHSFHIYNREYMLENNAPWNFTENNPYLYKLFEDSLEFFDVDTEEDFKVCESIYYLEQGN
jgi:CMP-N-acetylneuraminic acid synthetase